MKTKRISLIVLLLLFTLSISVTLAVWSGYSLPNDKSVKENVILGWWKYSGDENHEDRIEDGYHIFEDDIEIKKNEDGVHKEIIIHGHNVNKFDVLVFYDKLSKSYIVLPNPAEHCHLYHPNGGGCFPYDTPANNPNPYKIVSTSYYMNLKYNIGDVVWYGDNYYLGIGGNVNGERPSNRPYGPWELFDTVYTQNINYEESDQVIYNGKIFKANKDGILTTPGSNNDWNEFTMDFRKFNNYVKNDIVIYKGKVYRANAPMSGVIPVDPEHSNYLTSDWRLASEPSR